MNKTAIDMTMAVQPRQQPAFSTAMIQSDVYIDTTCCEDNSQLLVNYRSGERLALSMEHYKTTT